MIWLKYIIDGGAFLYKIPWPRMNHIHQSFCYVTSNTCRLNIPKRKLYLMATRVHCQQKARAFIENLERSCVKYCLVYKWYLERKNFCQKKANKSRFSKMLVTYLANRCVHVFLAKDDADVLIVQTAVNFSCSQNVAMESGSILIPCTISILPNSSWGVSSVQTQTIDCRLAHNGLWNAFCSTFLS